MPNGLVPIKLTDIAEDNDYIIYANREDVTEVIEALNAADDMFAAKRVELAE